MSEDSNLRKEACDLAYSLLSSDEKFLDKIIALWKIGNRLYETVWDTEFHIFGVIESDTDHLPSEEVRQYCSQDMLGRVDEEMRHKIAFYKKDVTKACQEILLKYENV